MKLELHVKTSDREIGVTNQEIINAIKDMIVGNSISTYKFTVEIIDVNKTGRKKANTKSNKTS